jgi:spermidine/putrescine-binding protein
MKKVLFITLAAAMLITLLPATAFAASDETLIVGSGGYSTIQQAVNAISADPGTKTIQSRLSR